MGPGGPCEGAQVVYQEDNAGPHTEHAYTEWMRDEFSTLGWKLEFQAPQGIPYSLVPYTAQLLVSCIHGIVTINPYLS